MSPSALVDRTVSPHQSVPFDLSAINFLPTQFN